jgi:hypothetical protein
VPWFKLFAAAAGDRGRFLLRLELWLFRWIPSFFYQNYQQSFDAGFLFRPAPFLAGVIGAHLGRRGGRPDPAPHTGDRAAARRNVIVAGMLGGFCS